jgi:hypothetical protein
MDNTNSAIVIAMKIFCTPKPYLQKKNKFEEERIISRGAETNKAQFPHLISSKDKKGRTT